MKLIAPLGAGGIGEVYGAHDARVGRDVAAVVEQSAAAPVTMVVNWTLGVKK
jgi:hypothetical protein